MYDHTYSFPKDNSQSTHNSILHIGPEFNLSTLSTLRVREVDISGGNHGAKYSCIGCDLRNLIRNTLHSSAFSEALSRKKTLLAVQFSESNQKMPIKDCDAFYRVCCVTVRSFVIAMRHRLMNTLVAVRPPQPSERLLEGSKIEKLRRVVLDAMQDKLGPNKIPSRAFKLAGCRTLASGETSSTDFSDSRSCYVPE